MLKLRWKLKQGNNRLLFSKTPIAKPDHSHSSTIAAKKKIINAAAMKTAPNGFVQLTTPVLQSGSLVFMNSATMVVCKFSGKLDETIPLLEALYRNHSTDGPWVDFKIARLCRRDVEWIIMDWEKFAFSTTISGTQ